MSIISILPDHVANQIAAGEVVQRPASVVKELLENAIDAGATKITLNVVGAGRTSIMVVDNGSGMDEDDAKLCFTRHATSKIKNAEDLFNLHTRGFRGEAMASIAAVSHVVMRTKKPDASLGLEMIMEDGEAKTLRPFPGADGTTVEVKNLFYNVPARRKFLKNDRIELRHCIDEFQRVALIHTDIHWVMKSEGNIMFQLPPEPFRRRISAIFGRKYDERLVPISENTDVVKVEGFVLKPEFAKKKRGEQFFFVNGRFIKSPYLHNALREAFEDVLSGDHHPGYFLNMEVHPNNIDVNIHPTKTEVKFEDERAIYAVLRSAARHAIGQFNVAPTIDFESEQSFQAPPMPAGHIPQMPKIQVDPHFNPFESTKPSTPRFRTVDEQYDRIQAEKNLNFNSELQAPDLGEAVSNFWNDEAQIADAPQSAPAPAAGAGKVLPWGNHFLTTLGDRVLIIDIKAARFRIFFDQIWQKLSDSTVPSQQLLFPEEAHFSVGDAVLIDEHLHALISAGFDLEPQKNPGSYALAGIPVMLSPEEAMPALEQFLESIASLEDVPEENVLLKELATSIAMKAAKYQHSLHLEELVTLKDQLLSSSNPQFTPRGKTIITELSKDQLNDL